MPSSSLNRILRGLERAGYVLRDDDGSYRLGIARRPARPPSAAPRSTSPASSTPTCARWPSATSELVLFAVAEPALGVARYVAAVDSPQRLRVTAELGTRVPADRGRHRRVAARLRARRR